jgi:hypothetical protein
LEYNTFYFTQQQAHCLFVDQQEQTQRWRASQIDQKVELVLLLGLQEVPLLAGAGDVVLKKFEPIVERGQLPLHFSLQHRESWIISAV